MNRTRIMNDARFISVVALCLLLVACSAEGDIPGAPQEDSYPIGFATTVEGPQSRGSLTTTNLRSMGVFAYYTGSSNWATSHKPNFMFNQIVTRTGSSTPWTYSPVKYWPNNPNDKISFFAYAPSGATGVSLVTTNTSSNYPILKYRIPFTATSQTDLLAATPLMDKTQSTTALSFQMKHVMTRVLVKAKCAQTITINRVQLNEAYLEAKLAFNATGTSWFEINSLTNFTHSTPTTVTANTTKDVAEFFMIPATGKYITVNFTYNGTTEAKRVALPTTPKWTEGTSIAYTLNIEIGSEITLTAKSWDTSKSQIDGVMGEDVPIGTQYPYVRNGVVYESATKSYYVGLNSMTTFPGGSSGWYSWHEMVNICNNLYTSGPYPKGGWRLPSRDEMYKIRSLIDPNTGKTPAPGTTYWSSTESGTDKAYVVWGEDGSPSSQPKAKTDYAARSLCIRDL